MGKNPSSGGKEKLERSQQARAEAQAVKIEQDGVKQRGKDHAPIRTEISQTVTMPRAVMILTGKGMKITSRNRNLKIIQR